MVRPEVASQGFSEQIPGTFIVLVINEIIKIKASLHGQIVGKVLSCLLPPSLGVRLHISTILQLVLVILGQLLVTGHGDREGGAEAVLRLYPCDTYATKAVSENKAQ